MEPVELTIITRNKTKEGLNEIVRDTSKVGQTVEQVTATFKARMKEQSEVVKQVEADIKSLEKQLEKAAPGKAKMGLTADLDTAKKVLAEEKGELASLEKQVDQSSQKHIALRTEIRNLKQEMVGMKEGTEEYASAMQRLGDMQDRMGDIGTQGRIFSDDNKNIKATMDAVSGLTGIMTAGVGVASLFGVEQEKLAQIQTKLQAVMAITMGVQQVANTLNKDSYFTHVLLVKWKTLLTAANTRLAVSLGISNVAAKALMATLTLGVTAAIGALIYLWDRYADSQEKAAAKVKERVEIEKGGRAQMIQTRTELENTIRTLKEFSGTKEQEAAKVKELNGKYGEAFGYYKTVAEWYDILSQKSDAYVQSLFMQAKAQSLINKAVTADEKVNEVNAKPDDSYDTWWGTGGKVDRFFGSSTTKEQNINSIKSALKKEAEEERDAYLKEAENLQKEIAEFNKKNSIGGFIEPSKITSDKESQTKDNHASALLRQQRENEQSEINMLPDNSEKKRRQALLNYKKDIDEAKELEKEWTEIGKGKLSEEDSQTLSLKYTLADSNYLKTLDDINKEEVQKNEEKVDRLLKQYQTMNLKRETLEKEYNEDMSIYNEALKNAQSSGDSVEVSNIQQSIEARTKAYKDGMAGLQDEMLRTSDFYSKLFADYSSKGYLTLKQAVENAKKVLDGAISDGEGVTISLPVLGEDGKVVQKQTKITVEEFAKMQGKLNKMSKELESENPFRAISSSFSDLSKAIKKKDNAAIGDAIQSVQANMKKGISQVKGWGEDLGAVFGDSFSQAVDEIAQMAEGVVDLGAGLGQIAAGDLLGGITGVISGISSIFQSMTAWKEKYEAYQRQIYIGELNYNRLLREQNEELASQRNTIAEILKDTEELEWLIQNGFTSNSSSSVWEASQKELNAYRDSLKGAQSDYDELRDKLNDEQATTGWVSTGSMGAGYQKWWDIGKDTTKEQLALWNEQGYLQGNAKVYYDTWVETGGEIEDIVSKIENLKESMQEMVMGTSFDSFLGNSLDVLKKYKGDVKDFADFTEDTISQAILNSFMYQDLAKSLEPLYNDLSGAFIDGTADKDYLENWKKRYENVMRGANDRLEFISDSLGIDVKESESDSSQSGRSGSFTTMSQEQGTKLEGLFTSLQDHSSSMDATMTDISQYAYEAIGVLNAIAENTAYCKLLEGMADAIERIDRDGVKMK